MPPHIQKIGVLDIETPALFASYRIGDFPRAGLDFYPWKITGTRAVLANAYDLLANQRTRMYTPEIKKKRRQTS